MNIKIRFSEEKNYHEGYKRNRQFLIDFLDDKEIECIELNLDNEIVGIAFTDETFLTIEPTEYNSIVCRDAAGKSLGGLL